MAVTSTMSKVPPTVTSPTISKVEPVDMLLVAATMSEVSVSLGGLDSPEWPISMVHWGRVVMAKTALDDTPRSRTRSSLESCARRRVRNLGVDHRGIPPLLRMRH